MSVYMLSGRTVKLSRKSPLRRRRIAWLCRQMPKFFEVKYRLVRGIPKGSSYVPLPEWEKLALSTAELVSVARFMNWLDPELGDESVKQSIEDAAAALADVGLPQGPPDEFEFRLEHMLTSGLHPDKYRELYG